MVSVAMHVMDLTLGLKHPHSKARSVVCVCNIGAEETELGGSWGLLGIHAGEASLQA